jgi:hypothetical protein
MPLVDKDINSVEYSGGRAALRWIPNGSWTVDVSAVYQQMDANSYSEDDVRRSGREYAVVRFQNESRSDEWMQLALTLQGDFGWAQFTSATSYFTRNIAYFQDNTDYTFYRAIPSARTTRSTTSAPIPPASAGTTVRSSIALRRNPLAGLRPKAHLGQDSFTRSVEEGFSFFSRIEDYEDTVGSQTRGVLPTWSPVRRTTRFTTRRTIRRRSSTRHSASDLLAERGPVVHGGPALVRPHAQAQLFHRAAKRECKTSDLGTAEKSTSDITKKLVQHNINENAMVYALYSDGFRAGGQRREARDGPAGRLRRDFLDNYEMASRAAGPAANTLNLTAFRMEEGSTRSRSPIRARFLRSRRQCRRRPDRRHQPRFQHVPLGLARLRAQPAAARPDDEGQ